MKLLAALLITLPLYVACEREGPLERAAEEVDEAFEDARNGGETLGARGVFRLLGLLGNKVDDAIDDVRDGVADAADEVTK
jgi:hypothetical protein